MRSLVLVGLLLAVGLLPTAGPAVVVFGSGDPDFNDAELHPPDGPLAQSGLQFVGEFHGFTATPIGPTHFLTASHVGGGSTMAFHGVSYPVLDGQVIPGTDLAVYRIDPLPLGPFPAWAPLYTRVAGGGSEVGRTMVVFGRGRRRGAEVQVAGQLAGWLWGDFDGRLRWGVNRVSANQVFPGLGQVLLATFDGPAGGGLGDFEAHLSEVDSGGPMFVREAGVWKLAGIHFGVEGPFSAAADGSKPFFATIFDGRGLWLQDDNGVFQPVTGAVPQPSAFGSSSVADSLAQILVLLGQADAAIDTFPKWRAAVFGATQLSDPAVSSAAADPDADGLPNLLEYALGAAPWEPSPQSLPRASIVIESGLAYAALTFPRARSLIDVTYTVEVSHDLLLWNGTPVATVPVATVEAGDGQMVTVRAAAPLLPAGPRYLRLRVALP